MKYKVGDKVKVREDLQANTEYNNCTCVEEMEEYRGAIATIKKCFDTDIDDDGAYEVDIDEGEWFWTDDMFEGIANNDTVDIGYYLEYCGHRIIKNVYYGGYAHDTNHVFCTTVDGKNQYTLPVNSIEFIIPHEVD